MNAKLIDPANAPVQYRANIIADVLCRGKLKQQDELPHLNEW